VQQQQHHLVWLLLLKDYEVVCVVSVCLGLAVVALLTPGVEICKLAEKIFYTFDLSSCPIRRLESPAAQEHFWFEGVY
jgi:hypothetical protein